MAESPETPASPAAHSAHATPGTPATPATRATRQAAAGGERLAHVGLVGLGRMGRNVFRLLHDSTDLRLEAVSDAAPPATPPHPPRFLTPQPAGAPDITVAMGVNDSQLRREHRIVCLASSTVQAAAPVASILRDAFGIRRAILTTARAYTDHQRLADVPADEPRRGRAAAENIIPRETGDAAVLSELLPELRGKLTGLAMSVPVPNGSVVDLVCWHDRPVTVEEGDRGGREA